MSAALRPTLTVVESDRSTAHAFGHAVAVLATYQPLVGTAACGNSSRPCRDRDEFARKPAEDMSIDHWRLRRSCSPRPCRAALLGGAPYPLVVTTHSCSWSSGQGEGQGGQTQQAASEATENCPTRAVARTVAHAVAQRSVSSKLVRRSRLSYRGSRASIWKAKKVALFIKLDVSQSVKLGDFH